MQSREQRIINSIVEQLDKGVDVRDEFANVDDKRYMSQDNLAEIERIKRAVATPFLGEDAELEVMSTVWMQLSRLDSSAKRRVLDWLDCRLREGE